MWSYDYLIMYGPEDMNGATRVMPGKGPYPTKEECIDKAMEDCKAVVREGHFVESVIFERHRK